MFEWFKALDEVEELKQKNEKLKAQIESLKNRSGGHMCGSYCEACKHAVKKYHPVLGAEYVCLLDCGCMDFEKI